jgi:hypothetical protein
MRSYAIAARFVRNKTKKKDGSHSADQNIGISMRLLYFFLRCEAPIKKKEKKEKKKKERMQRSQSSELFFPLPVLGSFFRSRLFFFS